MARTECIVIVISALIILIVLALFGGLGYGDGAYRTPGISLAGLLLILLLFLVLTGALD